MAQIQRESLARQQMYRNRIPGKRVDRQNVELLRLLILQGNARVSQDNVDPRGRVAEIAERTLRDGNNLRIDFVKAKIIAGLSVSRQRTNAQPYRADAFRVRAAMRKRQSHTRIRPVICRRQETRRRVDVLRAVFDLPVVQRSVRLLKPVCEFPYT